MARIVVPVLWDQENNFLNNALYSINVTATVVATVLKPTKIHPPAQINPPMQSCIQIRDAEFNTLYVNMPLSAYQAAIKASGDGIGQSIKTKIFNILSPSNTITDTSFLGATLVAVWVNGIEQDITGILSGDTITLSETLEDGDTVGVIYY